MSFQSTIHHDWRGAVDQIISFHSYGGKDLLLFCVQWVPPHLVDCSHPARLGELNSKHSVW